MFYSQTFLARKGPLGTVWCAAHLQHRLKKSHYTSTDISSTVDRIMFPEVPIALRMSGHLLLGVVRIYSKKVDYLFQDCNVVLTGLKKAFASIEVNLPEDAMQAPVHSITLPETFDLDALNLDDDTYLEWSPDHHLKSPEDITITVQIPAGGDPYVAITFDEDITMELSSPKEAPTSGVELMEEDTIPPADAEVGPRDPGPSGQTEVIFTSEDFGGLRLSNRTDVPNMSLNDDSLPQNFPEIEVMRDAVHDFSTTPPISPNDGNDRTEPLRSSDKNSKEKQIQSPILEDLLFSGGQSFPFQQQSEPPASGDSQQAPDVFDTHVSFGHSPLDLAIRSTPPVQQPKPRGRKRRLFDKSTVLTNKYMKKALEDSSDLLRKRRSIMCNDLGLWKLNNSMRKEQLFSEPSMTGLSADICDLFEKDYVSSKPHLAVLEEAVLQLTVPLTPTIEIIPQPGVAQSTTSVEAIPEPTGSKSPTSAPEIDMEIERLRHDEGTVSNDPLPEFVPSPARSMPSPFRRDVFTPFSNNTFISESVPQGGTTGSRTMLTTDSASTLPHGSEIETPMTFLEERLGLDDTGLSDIPELMNSADAEDLYFLEADNNTPTGLQRSEGLDSLSVRTRAVAQYLKGCSPTSLIIEDSSSDLSLNKMLEGKRKKLCARMFFETLVLKSYGLIDVQQEQPYGDITLKLTPMLSKAQI